MRRAMMTMRPFGGAPFTLGDPAISQAGNTSFLNRLYANLDNPAPRAGVVTTVKAYAIGAGDFIPVTCTVSAGAITVTSVGATVALSVGLNTLTVSLPVDPGGYIGFATGGSGAGLAMNATTGTGNYVRVNTGTVTAGTTYASGSLSATQAISLEGTGS